MQFSQVVLVTAFVYFQASLVFASPSGNRNNRNWSNSPSSGRESFSSHGSNSDWDNVSPNMQDENQHNHVFRPVARRPDANTEAARNRMLHRMASLPTRHTFEQGQHDASPSGQGMVDYLGRNQAAQRPPRPSGRTYHRSRSDPNEPQLTLGSPPGQSAFQGHQQNEVDPDVDYDNFSRHLNEHGDELREVYQYMNQHYPGSRRQQFTRPTFPSDPQNPTSGS